MNPGNRTTHPPRSRNHAWKRGAPQRIANGKRIAEARAAKARAAAIEAELYDLTGLEQEARTIASGND